MKRWLFNSAVPLVLAIIGTAALIYSWNYEKQALSSAVEEVNRLNRSQLVIDIDEVARDQWIIALNQETSKSKPNQEVLIVAAQGAVENLARWQSHMEMRVANSSTEYQQTIAARESMIAQAKKYVDAKNYPKLIEIIQNFIALSRATSSTSQLDKAFFTKVDEANAKVLEIEASMRLWYIIGTAALLFSSILSSLLLNRSTQQNDNHLISLKEELKDVVTKLQKRK